MSGCVCIKSLIQSKAKPFNRFNLEIEGCGLLVNLRDRYNLPTKDKIPATDVSVIQRFHRSLTATLQNNFSVPTSFECRSCISDFKCFDIFVNWVFCVNTNVQYDVATISYKMMHL